MPPESEGEEAGGWPQWGMLLLTEMSYSFRPVPYGAPGTVVLSPSSAVVVAL